VTACVCSENVNSKALKHTSTTNTFYVNTHRHYRPLVHVLEWHEKSKNY